MACRPDEGTDVTRCAHLHTLALRAPAPPHDELTCALLIGRPSLLPNKVIALLIADVRLPVRYPLPARVLLQEDAAPLELLADGSYVPIQTVAAEEAEAAAAA